jgi:hypothetical protein
MECTFGLIDDLQWKKNIINETLTRMSRKGYHFVASAHKDGNSTRVSTFFDDEHLIASCTERNLSYNARLAQLLFGEVFKAGYDSPMGRNGDEL